MLNKTEINAISNRIRKKLEEQHRIEKARRVYEYIPSSTYIEAESLLKEKEDNSKELEKLELKRIEINKKLDSLRNKLGTRNDLLKTIIDREINLSDVPTLEDIKEDLIIASIDSEFDVTSYINNQLEKYDYRRN